MSTVPSGHPDVPGRSLSEQEHPFWTHAFQAEMRAQQLADDHQAWTGVTGTLLTIVSMGVALAIISVTLCLLG
jgi:hypothetical protein